MAVASPASINTVKEQLQLAYALFILTYCNAASLRDKFLEEKAQRYANNGFGKKASIHHHLLHTECKQCTYRDMQHVTKPKASASLNHILVQDDSLSQWTPITDKTILHDCLLQRNQQHNNQAYGTLFTVALCSTTLNISNEQSDWTNIDTPDNHRKID